MKSSDATYPRVNRSSFMLSRGMFSSVSRMVVSTLPGQEKLSALSGLTTVLGGMGLSGAVALAISTLRKQKEVEDELSEQVGSIIDDAEKDAKSQSITSDTKKQEAEQHEFKPPKQDTTEPSIFERMKSMFKSDPPSVQDKPAPSAVAQASTAASNVPVSVLGAKLDAGYRSQYIFTGFSNSASITKGGSFTQSEANMVQYLKTKGVNTKASGKMAPHIEEMIRGYAKKYGVNEDDAVRVAHMESGGNQFAISSTGALGVYQFTGRTASDQGISNRFDAAQNIEAGVRMMADSSKRLKAAGLNDDPISQYLVHQLGFKGARELLKAAAADKDISQLSATLQKAVRLNAGGKSAKTVKGYIEATLGHMDARVAAASTNDTAPQVATSGRAVPLSNKTANTSVPVAEINLDMDKVRTEVASMTPVPKASGQSSNVVAQASVSTPKINDVVRLPNGVAVATS